MHARALFPVLALLTCVGVAVAAPLFDFEADADGWGCRQEGSAVTVSRNAAEVKSGASFLEWSYAPGSPNAALIKSMPRLEDGAVSLDFWLRCSATACFQLIFREQDGSWYLLKTRAVAGQWGHYRVDFSDLMLGEGGPGNGRFDPGEVVGIELQDLTRLNVDDPADLTPRTVWLDGFTISEENVPVRRGTRTLSGRKELVFDEFEGQTLNWMGRVRPELTLQKVEERAVLRARYKQGRTTDSRFRLTDHVDPRYAGLHGVKIVARAATQTTLSVQLLERPRGPGPIYAVNVELPAGRDWLTVTVPIENFLPTRQDANGKLDLENCYLIQIMDVTPNDELRDAELELDSISALMPSPPQAS